MRQVKIGDEVLYVPWRGSNRTANILAIEICRRGEKYGRSVNRCDLDIKPYGVVELNNGHWCYFDQIKHVIKHY